VVRMDEKPGKNTQGLTSLAGRPISSTRVSRRKTEGAVVFAPGRPVRAPAILTEAMREAVLHVLWRPSRYQKMRAAGMEYLRH